MTTKPELAALMASDGDYEKKVSLLKKAVVSVTKQKQEVEGKLTQLQEELRTSTQRLMEAQRESTVLQRKVKQLEAQLEQERHSGSAFGQNMLKGLSSIIGSAESGGGRNRSGSGGGVTAQLALSPEDIERLATENEQLHRERYTYKTQLEDAQRIYARETEARQGEALQNAKVLEELQQGLTASTQRCNCLHADLLKERAMSDFCRHFFAAVLRHHGESGGGARADLNSSSAAVTVELQWPASHLPTSSSPEVGDANALSAVPTSVPEQVALSLMSAAGSVKTLLRGISVLAVVLREELPRRERATVGDLECLRDRLAVFLEAHNSKKDRLMYLLEQLEGSLSALQQHPQRTADAPDASAENPGITESFLEEQDEVLGLLLDWVALLRSQVPLLVESCVSYLPQDHTYALHVRSGAPPRIEQDPDGVSRSSPPQPRTTTDRAEFVEEVTKFGYAALACVEGSLAAVRMLVQRSPSAYTCSTAAQLAQGSEATENAMTASAAAKSSSLQTSPAMDMLAVLALQQFWWEGCSAVRALRAAARVLNDDLQDIAEACNKSEVRDALQYLSKCLRGLIAASATEPYTTRTDDVDGALDAVPSSTCFRVRDAVAFSPLSVRSGTAARSDHASASPSPSSASHLVSAEAVEELLAALAAADRAAASYYTQMNLLYIEVADKEDALQAAVAAVRQMRQVLELERADAQQTRQTMQDQISLLSNQLIEFTNAATHSLSNGSVR